MIHNHSDSDSATLPRLQSMTVIVFWESSSSSSSPVPVPSQSPSLPHLIWTRSQSNCKASMANDPPAAERVRKSKGTDHVTSYPPPLGPWINMRIKTTTTITTTITLIVVIIHRRRQRRRRGRRRCGRPRRPPPHHHEDRSQDLPTNFICLRLYLFCFCPLLVHSGDFSMDAISLPQTNSSAYGQGYIQLKWLGFTFSSHHSCPQFLRRKKSWHLSCSPGRGVRLTSRCLQVRSSARWTVVICFPTQYAERVFRWPVSLYCIYQWLLTDQMKLSHPEKHPALRSFKPGLILDWHVRRCWRETLAANKVNYCCLEAVLEQHHSQQPPIKDQVTESEFDPGCIWQDLRIHHGHEAHHTPGREKKLFFSVCLCFFFRWNAGTGTFDLFRPCSKISFGIP